MITKKILTGLCLSAGLCGSHAQISAPAPDKSAPVKTTQASAQVVTPTQHKALRAPASMSAQDAFEDANSIQNSERAFHLAEVKKSLEHAPRVFPKKDAAATSITVKVPSP